MSVQAYLGLDTSNYRTSAAVWESKDRWKNAGQLLPVPKGTLGLRQSDAVFHHVKTLSAQIDAIGKADLCAVGASTRPRAVEGSYMPCFLVGEMVGRSVATLRGLPFYAFSHQQGHLAAAAFSADKIEWLAQPFYAWHVSGGTTELLHVEPEETEMIRVTIVGGSTDLAAGQLVDRTGVQLGCNFPAGPQLEKLAETCQNPISPFQPKCTDSHFSLSGVENQIKRLTEEGATPEQLARYTLDTLARALVRATEQAMDKHPLPLLCAGGVMADKMVAETMKRSFSAVVASPELSGDNALGVALLAKIRQEGLYAL